MGDCTAQHYARTARTVAKSGVDPFLIQLYTRGGFSGTADGQEMIVKTGDVGVLDMARHLDTLSPSSSNITLVVPRALLAPFVKDVDALHGAVLRSDTPHGGLLADYMRSLHARIDGMTFAEANALTGSTVALIAACVAPSVESRKESRAAVASVLLFEIRRHIEANLISEEFTAEGISRRFAISRASLYRLFEPFGGVAKYVRKRRLYHSFLEITSPAGAQKRIGAIAYEFGFSSESDFSRAFRAAYGMAPREARDAPGVAWKQVQKNSSDAKNEPAFVRWLREI
jgi:AraC-like DNA-binding protein